jgi:hypothetical protein
LFQLLMPFAKSQTWKTAAGLHAVCGGLSANNAVIQSIWFFICTKHDAFCICD